MGKFYIFSAAVEADYIGLVIAAVLCSLISVFFYLRVVVVMYMEESREGHPNLVVSPALVITLLLTAAATLQMGVLPAGVWDLAVRSVRVLWG